LTDHSRAREGLDCAAPSANPSAQQSAKRARPSSMTTELYGADLVCATSTGLVRVTQSRLPSPCATAEPRYLSFYLSARGVYFRREAHCCSAGGKTRSISATKKEQCGPSQSRTSRQHGEGQGRLFPAALLACEQRGRARRTICRAGQLPLNSQGSPRSRPFGYSTHRLGE
jgi:hypothetical protein